MEQQGVQSRGARRTKTGRRAGRSRAQSARLALVSKRRSEHLANTSHALRTPLNSLLILSDLLARNEESNLTPRQTEFARAIHAAGEELLTLIEDMLDRSKTAGVGAAWRPTVAPPARADGRRARREATSRAPGADAAPERARDAGTALAGKRVLILGHDIRTLFALTALLEEQALEVMSAETGDAAMKMLEEMPVGDVVLMDKQMLARDGHAADPIAAPVTPADLLPALRRWLSR